MASVQVQTTTKAVTPIDGHGGRSIALAGSRLWALVDGGTDATDPNQCLWYSDDAGASWTKHAQVQSTGAQGSMVVYQDGGGTWHLHVAHAGTTSTSTSLKHRAIHSNVDTGTPGALSTSINIDAGGTNAGVSWAEILVTNTATNPRLWIVAHKVTGASAAETRVWYATTGASADTVGNWTALSGASGGVDRRMGTGVWAPTTGGDKLAIIAETDASPGTLLRYSLDPTAGTPALGSSAVLATLASGQYQGVGDSRGLSVDATTDYAVLAVMQPDNSNIDLFRSTDGGATWTQPSGWADLTGGSPAVVYDGANFQLLRTATFTSISAASVATLQQLYIAKATDAIGSPSTFSDTNGQVSSVALRSGNLHALYRAGTSSPYSARSDLAAVLAPAAAGSLPPVHPPSRRMGALLQL